MPVPYQQRPGQIGTVTYRPVGADIGRDKVERPSAKKVAIKHEAASIAGSQTSSRGGYGKDTSLTLVRNLLDVMSEEEARKELRTKFKSARLSYLMTRVKAERQAAMNIARATRPRWKVSVPVRLPVRFRTICARTVPMPRRPRRHASRSSRSALYFAEGASSVNHVP